MKSERLPVNKQIRARRVLVIDQDGKRRGEFLRDDAIRLAEEAGLDLVQVDEGPTPICKLMDYGKHLYSQKKKAKKGAASAVKTKEIKLGFQSDDNYVGIKTEQAKKFLERGNRVKVTVRFWGRQRAHVDLVIAKCNEVYESLKEFAELQSPPKVSGNQVSMLLTPKKS